MLTALTFLHLFPLSLTITWSVENVQRIFHGCFKEVSAVFQDSFDTVSKTFQGSFDNVLYTLFYWVRGKATYSF